MVRKKTGYYTLRNKSRELVCQIDLQSRRGTYFFSRKIRNPYIKSISLSGFKSRPAGLRSDGKGLIRGGYLLLKRLSEGLDKFNLTLDANGPTALETKNDSYKVMLNHNEFRAVLNAISGLRRESYRQQESTVNSFLHDKFPSAFQAPSQRDEYQPDSLAAILGRHQLLQNLSKNDVVSLSEFFPAFVTSYGGTGAGKTSKTFALSSTKRAAEVVYVDQIVKDYEQRLDANHNEHNWQAFLREYILLFNSNYATILEKENIALVGTKYPDFMLIDAYNYLDIYEIKKPKTNLLRKDESRGNYYWDVEITKAISQVENYISYVERQGPAVCEAIRKQKKFEVRVLKPRGIIIAGSRSQLQGDEVIEDSFRLLNNALKNIEIVLFDELLDNLRNFLRRIRKE